VLAITLNDKTAELHCSILHLITFALRFNHNETGGILKEMKELFYDFGWVVG
jgi:hypothetical protein